VEGRLFLAREGLQRQFDINEMTTSSAIKAEHLTKFFRVPQKEPGLKGALKGLFSREYRLVKAVREVDFSIQEGELVGFLGPNGAGKTTTLKMLSGLLYPTSGQAQVLGFVPSRRERAFQKQITMVMGQRTQLWWDLPAWDSFLLNQAIYEIPEASFQETVHELAMLLEIKDLLDVPVKKLSLGQRMKAELACSLLHRPRLLLLDEPTIGLDVLMQQKVRDFIRTYNARWKATVLLTSHNMDDISELCSRIIIIHHGRLLFDGPLTEIQERFGGDRLTDAMRTAFTVSQTT
jgi:ABC-2 type transport system ATP-binding protein